MILYISAGSAVRCYLVIEKHVLSYNKAAHIMHSPKEATLINITH